MQILSSYPSTTNDTEKAKVNSADATTDTSKAATENAAKETNEKSSFSTRAEKFAQLNKEFDITSSKFTITTEFVNRLAELNIISSDEAASLSKDLPTAASAESKDTVGQLKTDVDALIERVKPEKGVESLINLLEKSQEILNNLDGSKSKTFPIDPATAAAELEHFLKTDEAKVLTDKEVNVVKDLKAALNIADKLSPEQRTSAEVSKYMEILKNFG